MCPDTNYTQNILESEGTIRCETSSCHSGTPTRSTRHAVNPEYPESARHHKEKSTHTTPAPKYTELPQRFQVRGLPNEGKFDKDKEVYALRRCIAGVAVDPTLGLLPFKLPSYGYVAVRGLAPLPNSSLALTP